MAEDMKELTPEQYKMQLLLESFARKVVEYEDEKASLRLQLAMAQQQLGSGKQSLTDDTSK